MTTVTRQINFVHFLNYFIILQPILDILTYFSIVYLQLSITIGIVVRVLFMLLSLFYIFFLNQHRFKRYIIFFILLLFGVVGIGFLLNFFTKPVFYFFSEVQFIVKAIYFPVMFCAFLLAFKERSSSDEIKNKLLSSTAVAMTIVAVSFGLAIITNTSNTTYTYVKAGYTGWFFAGNEISAIIAITFPLVINFSIKKTNGLKDFAYWIPPILLALTSLFIGTKVSFFAILLTVVILLITNFAKWFSQYIIHKSRNHEISTNLLFSLALTAIFLLAIPVSPALENVSGDYEHLQKTVQNEDDENEEPSSENKNQEPGEVEKEKEPIIQSKILRILLSSRNYYFENTYTDYLNASLPHKLFGLGYAGFYKESPKLIEMDFFDLFFAFGIIGCIVLFLPVITVLWFLIKTLITNIQSLFRIENLLLVISIGLGFGIAFVAGHVLYAPAVSIYLALALVLLFNNNVVNNR